MSTNVGAIDLDLVLSSNKFNKQLGSVQKQATIAGNSIQTTFTKIGKIAAAAFSIKAIASFGKECIDLGSDLAEVQNVVDVAFPKMSERVNEFANNAIEQFGLSQTVAKKYMGTFGSMSKAFGFAEGEAEKMSESLTGLAGDVASFYNLSSDEAYTKLKSVFTGETESLKDLGVVMTQSALDSYALANGFGKTIAKMTEQEKVALRYKFVIDQLSLASGDFMRTQDGWANQTRVLSLRWQEFKASIGQGLINIFTPIIKLINTMLSKLQVFADAFKSFTEMIFGNAGGSNNQSSAITDVADSATSASNAVSGIGKNAAKTKKQLLGLRGIDVLNNTTTSKSDDSAGGGSASSLDFGNNSLSDTLKKANETINPFAEKMKELSDIFKKGFEISFGNTNFDGILSHLNNIKDTLINIWTDSKVKDAIKNWANTISFTLGQFVGSVARIGTNIAEGLIGSIDKYLSQNAGRIKDFITSMFDISSKDLKLTGDLWQALGEISDVFKSDTAKQIGADIIAIFANPLMSALELCVKFVTDLRAVFVQPIIDNIGKLKIAIENTIEPIETVLHTIGDAFSYIGDKWNQVYDEHVQPLMENLKTGLSDTFGKFLDMYNVYVAPALQRMADKFSELWNTYLKPFVDNVASLLGSITDAIKVFWDNLLKPFIDWIVQNVLPTVVPIIETIWNVVCDVFGLISNSIGTLISVVKGIIDFLVGVFTGDWDKAWNAVKGIFESIWNGVKGAFSGVWTLIKDIFKGAIDSIKIKIKSWGDTISKIWSNIWNGVTGVIKSIKTTITDVVKRIIDGVVEKFNNLKSSIKNILNTVKNTVSNIWNSIWGNIKKVANSILGGIEGMVNGVIRGLNKMIGAINKLKFDVPDWVPRTWGENLWF